MHTLTAKEAKNNFGAALKRAAESPVTISFHNKPRFIISKKRNAQDVLDDFKHALSCHIAAKFSLEDIRKRSLDNLKRWKARGSWGPAYAEWQTLLESCNDHSLITAMVGRDDNSNRLRQSPPYTGLISEAERKAIHEKISP